MLTVEMSQSEVQTLAGRPTMKRKKPNGVELWIYIPPPDEIALDKTGNQFGGFNLVFRNGKLSDILDSDLQVERK